MELYIYTQGIAGWAPMNPSWVDSPEPLADEEGGWMGSPEPPANVEGAVSAECAHSE